jgi:hypothetical protein
MGVKPLNSIRSAVSQNDYLQNFSFNETFNILKLLFPNSDSHTVPLDLIIELERVTYLSVTTK